MIKTKFACNSCGYESGKWYGKCPDCGAWNSFEEIEVKVEKKGLNKVEFINASSEPQKISSIKNLVDDRLPSGIEEFDRVLGGNEQKKGIVPGSVTLLSGDPGIGKSTLLLQLAMTLSLKKKKVLYITGEESESQVKMRAERIMPSKKGEDHELYIYSTTNVDRAADQAKDGKFDLIIVDSIQTMASESFPGFPGSIPQIRYSTSKFVAIAKTLGVPVFLVGHVTKEGIVAGPMILSHMVDTVLYLEGEVLTGTRVLRSFKNRFGDASEVGIFVMEEKGLIGIKDSTSFFMNKKDENVPGSCMTVVMEGSRPLLVEIQALVVPTNLSFPRRVSTGISEKRLELLLAVIQKQLKLPLDRLDVFVNTVGGLKIKETATDLAVCLSIISSFKNKPMGETTAIAELGLLGELKGVINLDKRIAEAKKFGFSNVVSFKKGKYLSDIISTLNK